MPIVIFCLLAPPEKTSVKNKVTTKIKGSTTQRVQNIANKVKNKTIPTKTTQHLKKSTQEIAKGIISTLNGK